MEFHDRLAWWLEFRGKTQADLARGLKLSTSAVAQWSTGGTRPTAKNLDAIIAFFETTASVFWGDLVPKAKAHAS